MKIHYEPPKKSPFIVPAGYYVGRLLNYREPTKRACSCPIQDQIAFDYELTDPFADVGEEYRAQVTVCKNPTCSNRPNGLCKFLASWLEDKIEQLTDEHGDIDLDQLLRLKGDVEIATDIHNLNHPHPYSQVKRVLPHGRLID